MLLIDSQVGILCETTVGLDAHDEEVVGQVLTRLTEGRTAIMTSHQSPRAASVTPAPIPSLPVGAAR